jgi:hypothetical protein
LRRCCRWPCRLRVNCGDAARPRRTGQRDGDLLRRPLEAAEREAGHLRDIAEEGESGATPAILIGMWIAVVVPLVAAVIALAFVSAGLIG